MNKNMNNILYLSHTGSAIGGGENQLLGLIRNLDRDLYNPITVCPDAGEFSDKLKKLGVPVHICHLPGWRKAGAYPFRLLAAARLSKLAREHHIHLVHTSDLWLNYYAWRVGRSLAIPAISHVRNLLQPEHVQKHLFHRFDRIIAISKRIREPLVSGGILTEKIEVIYNGIDLSEFDADDSAGVLQRDDKHLVGLIGRIEPFKRQKEFVRIAAEVLETCQDVGFLIIGDPPEGRSAYLREVQRAVEEYNISDHVVFTGYRRDMPNVLASLNMVVTLSAGSIIMEAMASGLPVIGTDIASTSEIIQNNVTGLLLPQDDTHAVSEAIIRLLKDRKMRGEMGKSGRKRAEKLFDERETTRLVEAIYRKLLSFP